MAELTVEQQQALAIARARLRLQEQQPATSPTQADQEPDLLASVAANPITRFAVAAGSPFMGAGEWLPGSAGKWFAEQNKEMKRLVEQGKMSQPEYMQWLGGASDIAGTVMSPAFLKLGQVLPAAKTTGELFKQGMLTGAVGGAATATGESDIGTKGEATAFGTVGGGMLTPALGRITQGVTNLLAPTFSEKAAEAGAAKLAVKAAGERAPQVAAALQQATPEQTAAQAALPAGSSEFTALQRILRGQKGTEFGDVERAQEAARMAALRGVTPDKSSSVAARKAAADPYYSAADKAVVTMDSQLMNIFERMPKGVLEAAEDIARMDGRQFQIGKYTPAQQIPTGVLDAQGNMITQSVPAQYPKITGESLHYIKRALSDISNADPSKGIGKDAQSAARDVMGDFIKAFEQRVPEYKIARKLYADKSEPVNQSEILTRMGRVLEKETGGERVTPFLNVLGRGEEALLKKSTGMPRFESGDLKKVLTQDQYDVVSNIAGQLRSGAEITKREAEGMTSALKAIRASESKDVRLPSLINYKITIINSLLNRLEGIGGEKIERKLAEQMLPGQGKTLGKGMLEQINRPQGWLGDMIKYQTGIFPGVQGMLSGGQ